MRNANGTTLFADGFHRANDPAFPGAKISDGALWTTGDDVQLMGGRLAESIADEILRSGAVHTPLLRKDFTLTSTEPITSARAYVDGLGFYELDISGQKIGNRVLTPSALALHGSRRVPNLRRHHDAAPPRHEYDRLAAGPGVRSVVLAERMAVARPGGGDRQARDHLHERFERRCRERRLLARRNGRASLRRHLQRGDYDAAFEPAGWDTPGFDAAAWKPVRVVSAPAPLLQADTTPAVRVIETLRPVRVTKPLPDTYVFDLGQDIAGWARVHVTGSPGSIVAVHYAEALEPNGTLDTYTNRNAKATDTFVLSGHAETTNLGSPITVSATWRSRA